MKTVLVLSAILAAVCSGYGAEPYNLLSPVSGIEEGEFEFVLQHRFFGAAFKNEPLETFFGLDNGANAMVAINYSPWRGISLGAFHSRLGRTHGLLSRWHGSLLPPLLLGVEAGLTSFKPAANADREMGIVAAASLSMPLLNGRVRPTVSYAFDWNRENDGAGAGMEVALSRSTALFGEYFPWSGEGRNDCYSLGARYTTWGHQFHLGLTNGSGIGIYEQLEGSSSGDLSFGLSVRRKF